MSQTAEKAKRHRTAPSLVHRDTMASHIDTIGATGERVHSDNNEVVFAFDSVIRLKHALLFTWASLSDRYFGAYRRSAPHTPQSAGDPPG